MALVAGRLLGGTVDAGTGVEVLDVVEAGAAPGPERPGTRLPRRTDDEGEAREKGLSGAGCSYGKTMESLMTVRTRCANGRDGCVLDARNTL